MWKTHLGRMNSVVRLTWFPHFPRLCRKACSLKCFNRRLTINSGSVADTGNTKAAIKALAENARGVLSRHISENNHRLGCIWWEPIRERFKASCWSQSGTGLKSFLKPIRERFKATCSWEAWACPSSGHLMTQALRRCKDQSVPLEHRQEAEAGL